MYPLAGEVLNKLNDLVRPFVHKILVVIEPLLIDEDYYARMEGRRSYPTCQGRWTRGRDLYPEEDIDNPDEYVEAHIASIRSRGLCTQYSKSAAIS